MNAPIYRLYATLLLLLTVLVGYTSRWTVFDAEELRENTFNKRPLLESQGIPRGEIRSIDGEVIARSVPEGQGSQRIYKREYPLGALFGHPVGYDFINTGLTGIEASENDALIGKTGEFATLLEELQGKSEEGDDLVLTLDADAQRLATSQLEAIGFGSVVAIEPATGAIRVMASNPGFDPNSAATTSGLEAFYQDDATSPLLQRAIQSAYPPGSTMKVVSAVAAIDSGQFTPDSIVDGTDGQLIDGVPLHNFAGESPGMITLTTALTDSVNTAWANVGEALGAETYFEYMDRFGFNQQPELDYPANLMRASGVRQEDGTLIDASDPVDIGRVAIGQERLTVTPLQMAEVAAAVANDGDLMKPQLVAEVVDPDGRVDPVEPQKQSDVMSPATAEAVTVMMVSVTENGTAAGLTVGDSPFAGKTGTAELGGGRAGCDLPNQVWFIGFAPADDPQIAVAATVECSAETGGAVAGPIATAVMSELLG